MEGTKFSNDFLKNFHFNNESEILRVLNLYQIKNYKMSYKKKKKICSNDFFLVMNGFRKKTFFLQIC